MDNPAETPLSYSQAMRLGVMLAPQCFDDAYDRNGATCAWAAALQACGVDIDHYDGAQQWPIEDVRVPCPACPVGYEIPLTGVVLHLNDEHRWTRERIADFVESAERQHPELCAPAPSQSIQEFVHA